jgi:hypothetical protein
MAAAPADFRPAAPAAQDQKPTPVIHHARIDARYSTSTMIAIRNTGDRGFALETNSPLGGQESWCQTARPDT